MDQTTTRDAAATGLDSLAQRVASSCGLPAARVRELLEDTRHGSVAAMTGSPDALAYAVLDLAGTLGLSAERALIMLCRRPELVTTPPQVVAAQADAASAAMGLPPEAAVALYAAQPSLLDVPIPQLSMHMRRMSPLLKVGGIQRVGSMLARAEPGALAALFAMPTNAMQQQLIDIQVSGSAKATRL
jgi:hypothetical protein